MVKTIRRLTLVTTMLTMGVCVVLARHWLPFEHSISQRNILIVGLSAAILALSILFWELRVSIKSWQLPEPEEPPTHTNHVILPPPPVEKIAPPPAAPAPTTKKVRPAAPPPAQRSGKIVVGNIEKTIKAAERAESYARHTNGRVKIALDDEPDDESDDA